MSYDPNPVYWECSGGYPLGRDHALFPFSNSATQKMEQSAAMSLVALSEAATAQEAINFQQRNRLVFLESEFPRLIEALRLAHVNVQWYHDHYQILDAKSRLMETEKNDLQKKLDAISAELAELKKCQPVDYPAKPIMAKLEQVQSQLRIAQTQIRAQNERVERLTSLLETKDQYAKNLELQLSGTAQVLTANPVDLSGEAEEMSSENSKKRVRFTQEEANEFKKLMGL